MILRARSPERLVPEMAQTTWSSYIAAGWLIVGGIKSQLEALAFACDVSIRCSVSYSLVGRVVSFTVRGEPAAVAAFKRGVASATTTPFLS